jgi:hypothetical protein
VLLNLPFLKGGLEGFYKTIPLNPPTKKELKQFPNKARCQSTGFAPTIKIFSTSTLELSKILQRTAHAL